jgi:hypothetical protein
VRVVFVVGLFVELSRLDTIIVVTQLDVCKAKVAQRQLNRMPGAGSEGGQNGRKV